jgi:feruloyl esterase
MFPPLRAIGSILGIVVLASSVMPATARAASCESLANSVAPTVSLTATLVDSGALTPNAQSPNAESEKLSALPPFCRVIATLRPTSDSDIRAEIWLPVSGWNGRLVALGNGGWGGAIYYERLADALRRGYATTATDDGHADSGARFIMGHPEKFIDYAYRAQHEMTVAAKRLIKEFYGEAPHHSYWNGCSAGGREGLLQAARYPDEFDGIVAGDPANVRRNAWALWLAVQTFKEPAARIPADKYPLLHRAALDACDAADGLSDGLIAEPGKCHVDFARLTCKGADSTACLTPPQVRSAQTIVSPATSGNGEVLFPRLEPGTELRWDRLAGGPEPADLFLDQFRYVVYQDPGWDWRSFDLARDAAKSNAANRGIIEFDPNLAAFAKRGGKLFIYHGWADQQVAPGSSIEFYESVAKNPANPAPASDWIRLFMVPGMAHCRGGEGPDNFDTATVIENWVEHGKAPERIVATRRVAGKIERSRPLCPYPQTARYNGTGSIDAAANFTCRSPG